MYFLLVSYFLLWEWDNNFEETLRNPDYIIRTYLFSGKKNKSLYPV